VPSWRVRAIRVPNWLAKRTVNGAARSVCGGVGGGEGGVTAYVALGGGSEPAQCPAGAGAVG
jgi:hypothetical protein